jgi:hypothetical protein
MTRPPLPVALFALAVVVVPFVHGELYPFTDGALFTDAQPVFAVHEVVGPDGRTLPAAEFGLGLWYDGLRGDSARHPSPGPRGMARPATVNLWGKVPAEDEVRAAVAAALARPGAPPFVTVVQRVVGATGEDEVGVVAERTWRVP